MNPNLGRALLLIEQSRYELAEAQLRQVLADVPDHAYAHSLLALCLCERELFREATEEAQQAVHLAPDADFSHYALARVLHERHREDEALDAINEAIRIEPSNAGYFALLAQIQLSERRWPAALEAAERGLQQDPEHVGCTNLRAIALVKLGRKAEAGATIDSALSRNPDNSLTHANQGWTLLEKGEPKKALEHFRESLRLDPENDWARQGIVEALKARNIIYAVMLKYFLWMAKFRQSAQWGIVIGAYVGNQLLGAAAKAYPPCAPWVWPLRILYIAFALMTWIASPLFNLMLRLNRFGRLALSREQTVASNWLGLCLLLVLVSLGGCVKYGFNSVWLVAALVFGFLLLPVAAVFTCHEGWPRKTMAFYAVGTALAGAATIAVFLVGDSKPKAEEPYWTKTFGDTLSVFIIAAVASGWVANFLLMQRPKR